ncbi:mechanosensitive ion channel family protein [Lyngbya aestuarii BL J]|uniref:Mechanosensitive ion channel family protein n=1 Tax=Lyngbya aestuarii BL J TaxID=1348334 RepID=U7QMK9_9CYAN|nr:mechanosensitive ion channel domain-containing protein [Lyngbya aestuarii]ERT08345.1 mechanosensitive ion channel family protein [Lyngbya aestuarii BL J]
MDMLTILKEIMPWNEEIQLFLISLGIRLLAFLFFIILSLIVGRYTPNLIILINQRFFPKIGDNINKNFIIPLKVGIRITGTLILISFCLNLLKPYEELYEFLRFCLYLSITISASWLLSRLFRQFLRLYGIVIIQKMGLKPDEFIIVLETISNVIIGFFAVIFFANINNFNLLGLVAGFGIGGIAIAFAAQRVLEQFIGTIVIYCDRPYVPGEYVRVNFNPHQEDTYGRIEAIGLRSTKIRIAARNTLLIVPNSIMATKDIENITRGKKVMVLLYLDFKRRLEEQETALIDKVVKESTDTLYGIDPGSTKITLLKPKNKPGTRARVTFFILGSSEDSTQLRKRLLELANEKISKKLISYGIEFEMKEPTIYVDSPIPI